MDATATLSRTPGPAKSSDTDVLFQPYRLGPFEVPHRGQGGPLPAHARGRRATRIANPDLPDRLRTGAPLNSDDPTPYFGGGEGDTD